MSVWTRLLTGLTLSLSIIAGWAPRAWATTLEQLTLDDMAQKSTSIVRARVTGSHAGTRGTGIYTYFQIELIETWKSSEKTSGQKTTEVAVPGGAFDGIRQSVTGAPELKLGQEYVLFLWTSRSGLTQVIGLSQGLFKVSEEGSEGGSAAVVQRPAASELMLNRSGLPVDDRAMSMPLQDLRTQVRQALASARLGVAKPGVAK
jgi:hypothetical protein